MKIAGLTMNDVWAQRVLADHGVETASTERVDAEIKVLMSAIELAHHGPEQKYRPYLHLNGELTSVRPHEQFPFEVDEITFPFGVGESVDVFYEFTDEQLSDLVAKGYFSSAFTTPDNVTGIEWELPATVDAFVLAPAEQELEPGVANVPVVFVRVHDLGDLQTDLEKSGYELVGYFEDYSAVPRQAVPSQTPERVAPSTTQTFEPLFDEREQALALEGEALEAPIAEPEAAKGDVAAQLRAAQEALDAEADAERRARASRVGSPEHVYASRVADSLREASDAERLEALQCDVARRSAELHDAKDEVPSTGYNL